MLKKCKKIFTILILSIILPISIQAQVLNVPEITQQQDQWCWIGSSICVLKYYGDTQLSQCQIATWTWDRATWRTCNDNCCNNPTGCCNYWNYNWGQAGAIDDILKNVSSQVSISVSNASGSISQTAVGTAIADGRPIIVRVNSGGHFIVIHGLQGNTLYFMDPWFGEGKGYQTYSSSQINGRSWTHTQTCTTRPNVQEDTQAPSVPSGLTASSITSSSANLSWSASTDNVGVTGYKVYRSSTLVTTVSSTSYNATGLSASTSYTYSVSAIDAAGNESAKSAAKTFTTLAQGNDPKTVGTTTAFTETTNAANRRGDSYVMPENGTITSISIYHKGGSGQMILGIYDGESSPANLLGKTNTVDINSSEGWQKVSLQSSVYVASGKKVWLSWVLSSNPSILVFTSSGNLTSRADAGTGWSSGMPSTFGTSSLANYNYSIYAEYTPGGSTPDTQAPSVPSGLAASSITTNSASLSWNASTDNVGVTGYKVYRSTTLVTTVTATTYNATGLSANTSYTYYISAVDAAGNESAKSSAKTFTTLEQGVEPKTVGTTTAFTETTNVTNRRADSYAMPENGTITSISMYHTGGSGQMILGIYEGTSSPTNLLAKTSTVNINSAAGWQKVNLQSSVYVASGKKIWLSWVLSSNPGILVFTSSGTLTSRADAGTGWTSGMPSTFGTSSLANYNYSIYAEYIPGGNTADTQAPSTPSGLAASSITTNSASLSWNASSDNVGVTGYKVYRSTTLVTTVTGTSYNATGLSANTSYTYYVSAVDAAGNESSKSSAVNFTTESQTVTKKVGTTTAYSTTTNVTNRRADSYTMPENGTITSISMYHTGGSGQMILGIYEGSSSPTNLLGKTATVNINASQGWQKVDLQSPVSVASGKKIWLSWVLSSNPGIIVYTSSGTLTPRADVSAGWTSGMPATFGTSSLANFNYSIYAEYTVGGSGSGEESLVETADNSFSMFPNPTKDMVTINFKGENNTLLKIISITGAIVKEGRLNTGENQIKISDLAKGVYFVTVGNDNKEPQKLIIQ